MIKKLEFLNDEDKNNLINQNKDMYVIAIEFGLKHNYITFSDTPLPEPEYDIWGTIKEQENKISILSEKVDAQIVENTKVEESQNRQDREIIDSLLASTELFEMVMAMMPVTINTKENERVNGMVTVYVTLILKGVKTIEDVPAVIRPQVQEQLDLLLK